MQPRCKTTLVIFIMQLSCNIFYIMGVTRQTKKVKTLVEIFESNKNAISVVDLVKRLENEMNKTTVYRILDKLMDDGFVHSFVGKGGLKWYAKCQNCSCDTHNDVHPHFQCKVCGSVKCLSVKFKLPLIEDHQIESINLLMSGVCNKCV